MKLAGLFFVFIFSTTLAFGAQSGTGQTSQEEKYRCSEEELRQAFASPQESLDFVTNCPNVLQVVNVLAEDAEEPWVNQSERQSGKGDLPVISEVPGETLRVSGE